MIAPSIDLFGSMTQLPDTPSRINEVLRIAELGFPLLPIVKNTKEPATLHGLKDATTDQTQIEKWHAMWPQANWAVRTNGLLVVDLDPVDGRPNQWMAKGADEFSAYPQAETPRGGRHIWTRQPGGGKLRCSTSKIAPGVDIKADEGYVLITPSTIDGRPYTWLPGFELDCDPGKLPITPAWLVELIVKEKERVIGDPVAAGEIPDGMRNDTLTSIGGNLRRIGMSQSAITGALLATNSERCRPPLENSEVEKIAWSVSRYEPDQFATAAAEGWSEKDDAEPDVSESVDPGPFPEAFCDVPGLIGEIIAWNLATAIKPQPIMALANALALMGTITGRKITDAMGTRTNLYAICLADSGVGKEHARRVSKELLTLANMRDWIGSEEIKSASGLVNAISKHPELLYQIDEIGRWLATLQNPGINPHCYEIISVLLRMFTSSNSFYSAGGYADTSKTQVIDQPHCCLYGTTVAKSFFEALTLESLSDGFMGRLLVFEATKKRRKATTEIEGFVPPSGVVEGLKWWKQRQPTGLLGNEFPRPDVLTDSAEARGAFNEIDEFADSRPEGTVSAALWVRAHEKARKLALLYAVSEDHDAKEVSGDAAGWGCGVVVHLTKRMEYLADRHISDGPFGRVSQKVFRIIDDSGQPGITGSGLCRATRNIRPRDREEILTSLRLEGRIISTSPKGRIPCLHRSSRFK